MADQDLRQWRTEFGQKNEAISSDEKGSVNRGCRNTGGTRQAEWSYEIDSVNCGCRGIARVIRPRLEGAEVSDKGITHDEPFRRAGIDVALAYAVYSSVQMLEKRPKSLT
jgi:hypothetical protein